MSRWILALTAASICGFMLNPFDDHAIGSATAQERTLGKSGRLASLKILKNCEIHRVWSEDFNQQPYLRKVRICA